MKIRTEENRFWSKVQIMDSGSCWMWRAHKRNGYGVFSFGGTMRTASHVAWKFTHGVLPEKPMQINHICHNPACVNPQHLRLGTQTENVRECVESGRARRTPLKGEKNGQAKLSSVQVAEIRSLFGPFSFRYQRGHVSSYVLAEKFGITRQEVSNIVKRKTWNP